MNGKSLAKTVAIGLSLMVFGMFIPVIVVYTLYFFLTGDQRPEPASQTLTCDGPTDTASERQIHFERIIALSGCELVMIGHTVDVLEYEPNTSINLTHTKVGSFQARGAAASAEERAELTLVRVIMDQPTRITEARIDAQLLEAPVLELEHTDAILRALTIPKLRVQDANVTLKEANLEELHIGPGGVLSVPVFRTNFGELVMEGEATNKALADIQNSFIPRVTLGPHSELTLRGDITDALTMGPSSYLVVQGSLSTEEFHGDPDAHIRVRNFRIDIDPEIFSPANLVIDPPPPLPQRP